MNALEIAGLNKKYKDKKGRAIQAVSDLSLIISRGEVFGFLGPNGAGKSTTIKTIMGLVTPSSGSVSIMGLSVTDPNARRVVGYLPENPAFFEFLTGREYLSFVGSAFGMSRGDADTRSALVLKRLDLETEADRPLRGYSKGMVQRLGLAQVLLHDPDIYILDEPMSGLDPIGRALVKEIICELKQRGKTVFFSTHVTADVEAVCDRVGIIVSGQLRTVERVGRIMESGVVGYSIKAAVPVSIPKNLPWVPEIGDTPDEFIIPKDKLGEFLAHLAAEGVEIRLVEPKRKDLEQFFLEVVSQAG